MFSSNPTPPHTHARTHRFDLVLEVESSTGNEGDASSSSSSAAGEPPKNTGLRGSLQFNTDLFDTATMARMATHFQVRHHDDGMHTHTNLHAHTTGV